MSVLKRRFNPEQTSDEMFNSETGYCTIEYYNSCKDPYRVAPGYKIPVPWPWILNRASEAGHKVLDDLEDAIRKVLARHNIITPMIGAFNFASRNTPERAKDTILIRTRDENNMSWKRAASEIYELVEPVAALSHIQMRVEIRNEEKMYCDVSEFIKDDATVDTITRIQPSIIEAVKQYCPGKWTSIACHNRVPKLHDGEKNATVIVFIKPGTMYAWLDFEDTIVDVIRSAISQGEAAVSVEVLPGRIS